MLSGCGGVEQWVGQGTSTDLVDDHDRGRERILFSSGILELCDVDLFNRRRVLSQRDAAAWWGKFEAHGILEDPLEGGPSVSPNLEVVQP